MELPPLPADMLGDVDRRDFLDGWGWKELKRPSWFDGLARILRAVLLVCLA